MTRMSAGALGVPRRETGASDAAQFSAPRSRRSTVPPPPPVWPRCESSNGSWGSHRIAPRRITGHAYSATSPANSTTAASMTAN
jgi:hypothetical protein